MNRFRLALAIVSVIVLSATIIIIISQGKEAKDSLSFTVDSGVRIEQASNPRIMNHSDGVLTLGYESQVTELQNFPSARGYVATSTDGLTFIGNRQFKPGENQGKGVYLESEKVWRRYDTNPELTAIISSTSTDGGKTYTLDEGTRFVLSASKDEAWIGVWSEWVDEDGGVVILFNNNVMDDGKEFVYVSRLYAEDGYNFKMTDQDVIDLPDQKPYLGGFRDPNTILLADGRIRMVAMVQNSRVVPPAAKMGHIYTLISVDNGRNFEVEDEAISYTDFTEFEVWSLNDPKIVMWEDGRFQIFVAAMVADESTQTNEGQLDFDWMMVSATSD